MGAPMVIECRTPETISGGVGLDLHAPAAAKALLTPPQLAVDGGHGNGDTGREAGEGRNQSFAVRLAGCFKSQHVVDLLWYRTARE